MLVLFCLFFSSFSVYASYLNIVDNNLYCGDCDCSITIGSNQKLFFNEKNKVVELLENDKVVNYYFYTTDVKNVAAYSGKPLEILLSLSVDGIITDVSLVRHSEPILLTGIHIEKLLEAVSFYKGKNINDSLNIGEDFSGGLSVPIIAGATVTSLILHETILNTAREVGVLYNIISKDDANKDTLTSEFKAFTWNELLKIGAIGRLVLDDNYNKVNNYDYDDEFLVDIYFADLSHPSVGKNLLGDLDYENLKSELLEGQFAIMILNNGTWSFKGNGFVRGGIFDRFRIEQGSHNFSFRDCNYKMLYDLDIKDIDDFVEKGVFIVDSKKYRPDKPFDLVLLVDYKSFVINYKLPSSFIQSGNSSYKKIWQNKYYDIIYFVALWFSVVFIFSIRDILVKNSILFSFTYNIVLLSSIYIIGVLQAGQPSIVNVFSLFENIRNLEIFLLDPHIFIGWIMIFVTVLLWGKSLFCGWICPFGALQELFFKIKTFVLKNNASIELPYFIIHKLRYLRYVILFFLIFISFKDMLLAEYYAEVEPFKTMWNVGIQNRDWCYSGYVISLLFTAVFMYRFFCRFLCPLGAFLSLLSIFQIFRLNRRGACQICKICTKSCHSYAIDSDGNIDNKECFGCFSCISNMYNKKKCPPILGGKNI